MIVNVSAARQKRKFVALCYRDISGKEYVPGDLERAPFLSDVKCKAFLSESRLSADHLFNPLEEFMNHETSYVDEYL